MDRAGLIADQQPSNVRAFKVPGRASAAPAISDRRGEGRPHRPDQGEEGEEEEGLRDCTAGGLANGLSRMFLMALGASRASLLPCARGQEVSAYVR